MEKDKSTIVAERHYLTDSGHTPWVTTPINDGTIKYNKIAVRSVAALETLGNFEGEVGYRVDFENIMLVQHKNGV